MTIREYLTEKNIPFREANGELVTKCLFNDCDRDSRGSEAHLYFNTETSQYDCKKCGAKGNLLTLAKHLGDTFKQTRKTPATVFTSETIEKCHVDLPDRIRQYLHGRGISDDVINAYKLG